MKSKSIYLIKLIKVIIATGILIYFFIKITSYKIIFIPFLICGVSMIGQNVFLIIVTY